MTNARTSRVTSIADRFGIMASTVCALHCILVPTLLITGTVLPASLLDNDELFHRAMLWIILPAALLAFGLGCWRHKDRLVLALGTTGLIGMALSATVLHDVAGKVGERSVTLVSAAILVTAHYRNFQLCRSFSCGHDSI